MSLIFALSGSCDRDLSRYNRTITNNGITLGDGMKFDTNAYYALDASAPYALDVFSIIAWINPNTLTDYDRIFEKWYDGADKEYQLYLRNAGTLGFQYSTDGSNSTSIISSVFLDTGRLIQIGIVVDNLNISFFGESDAQGTGTLTAALNHNTMIPRIGMAWNDANGFDGKMESIKIYNNALTKKDYALDYEDHRRN